MVSIISEANYNKMTGNLPPGYVSINRYTYNSFFYIGKILPQLLTNEKDSIYELLDTTWEDLTNVKVKFSINVQKNHHLDYH